MHLNAKIAEACYNKVTVLGNIGKLFATSGSDKKQIIPNIVKQPCRKVNCFLLVTILTAIRNKSCPTCALCFKHYYSSRRRIEG